MTIGRRGILVVVLAFALGSALVIGWGVVRAVDAASADDARAAAVTAAAEDAEDAAQPHRIGRIEVPDEQLDAVFLGDSITYGMYATTEAMGYRPRVMAALRAHAGADVAVDAIRFGAPGYTTSMVAAEADVPDGAELVVIALGTNDVKRTRLEDFALDYASLVRTVQARAPDATLVCLGVWAEQGAADLFDPFISKPCREAGGIFLPLSDVYESEGTRGPAGVTGFAGVSDLMHPNDRGFAAIAARITRAVGL